jgi:hypothetical protein
MQIDRISALIQTNKKELPAPITPKEAVKEATAEEESTKELWE